MPREVSRQHGEAVGLAPLSRTAPRLGRAVRPRPRGGNRGPPRPRHTPRPARHGGRSRRPRWAGASRPLNVSGERTPTPPVLRPPSRRTGRARKLGPGGAAGNPRASALPRTHRAPRERGKARSVQVALGSPEEGRAALTANLALVRLLRYVGVR